MYLVDWDAESEKATALVQKADLQAVLQQPARGLADEDTESADAHAEGWYL